MSFVVVVVLIASFPFPLHLVLLGLGRSPVVPAMLFQHILFSCSGHRRDVFVSSLLSVFWSCIKQGMNINIAFLVAQDMDAFAFLGTARWESENCATVWNSPQIISKQVINLLVEVSVQVFPKPEPEIQAVLKVSWKKSVVEQISRWKTTAWLVFWKTEEYGEVGKTSCCGI